MNAFRVAVEIAGKTYSVEYEDGDDCIRIVGIDGRGLGGLAEALGVARALVAAGVSAGAEKAERSAAATGGAVVEYAPPRGPEIRAQISGTARRAPGALSALGYESERTTEGDRAGVTLPVSESPQEALQPPPPPGGVGAPAAPSGLRKAFLELKAAVVAGHPLDHQEYARHSATVDDLARRGGPAWDDHRVGRYRSALEDLRARPPEPGSDDDEMFSDPRDPFGARAAAKPAPALEGPDVPPGASAAAVPDGPYRGPDGKPLEGYYETTEGVPLPVSSYRGIAELPYLPDFVKLPETKYVRIGQYELPEAVTAQGLLPTAFIKMFYDCGHVTDESVVALCLDPEVQDHIPMLRYYRDKESLQAEVIDEIPRWMGFIRRGQMSDDGLVTAEGREWAKKQPPRKWDRNDIEWALKSGAKFNPESVHPDWLPLARSYGVLKTAAEVAASAQEYAAFFGDADDHPVDPPAPS